MTLDEAVTTFANGAGSIYRSPFEASNACVEASGEFMDFLLREGVVCETEEERAWFDEHGWGERPTFGVIVIEMQSHSPDFTGYFYDFPYVYQARECVRWHAFNYVGDQCYDWTARQLWASAPFPLIWTPACSPSTPKTKTATRTSSTTPSSHRPAPSSGPRGTSSS